VTVAPGPNRYTVVDIPLVMGSVVEGRVVRRFGDSLQGVAGATLTLRDQAGVERSVATFSDGSFYVLGVRPGEYTLTVDARVLDILRMDTEPRRFSVTASGTGPDSVDLLLSPRP
jgi:Predicted outer membrane protein